MSYHDMFYHDMVNQNKDMYWYAMVQQCININKYHAVPPKPSLSIETHADLGILHFRTPPYDRNQADHVTMSRPSVGQLSPRWTSTREIHLGPAI